MISISNIYVQYGDRIVLNNINLVIGQRDKVGLVGRNGAGKSTLLKLIAGTEEPQSGNITRPTHSTLAFLHQDLLLPKGKTVIEEAMSAFEEIKQMEARLEELNHILAERTDYESDSYHDLLIEIGDLSEHVHLVGGSTAEADAIKILAGLGFKQSDMNRLTDEFSGGWQMRVELAKMLLRQPDYLLLDEPTNHLDIESIIWLESFLENYPGAIIIISHDKQFLDNITKRTIEIELGKVFDYKANYTKAMEMRKERRELQQNAFDNQQKVINQKERTITRFMAKASKTTMAQSMQKQLDKMERVEIDDEDTSAMRLQFQPSPRSGQIVVEGQNVKKQYDNLLVLDGVDFKMDRGDRVAFVGQNGQGKTTLAKILVGKEPATAGDVTLGHNVMIGYYAQNQADSLDPKKTLLETMEENSPPELRPRLRNILGSFMFSGEDVDKKVFVLSGGERARLAMACLLLRPINLLILDEPTNHLDIKAKEVLKKAVMEYDGSLIVVSHDRDFLADLTTRTIEFRDHHLYDHIGDVNAFLEKRALDNMRDVEMSSKVSAANNEVKKNNDIENKAIQKSIQQAERKIAELENEIKKKEQVMAEDGFFEKSNHTKILQEYNDLKKELDVKMAEWEEALEAMG